MAAKPVKSCGRKQESLLLTVIQLPVRQKEPFLLSDSRSRWLSLGALLWSQVLKTAEIKRMVKDFSFHYVSVLKCRSESFRAERKASILRASIKSPFIPSTSSKDGLWVRTEKQRNFLPHRVMTCLVRSAQPRPPVVCESLALSSLIAVSVAATRPSPLIHQQKENISVADVGESSVFSSSGPSVLHRLVSISSEKVTALTDYFN